MGYYADKYLKSEEWKSLRKERIIKDGFRCRICGKRPKGWKIKGKKKFGSGFQVHHIVYKNIHDVEVGDLRALCADCHQRVHDLLKKYPKMKTLERAKQWDTAIYHLRPESRPAISGKIRGLNKEKKPATKKEERAARLELPSERGGLRLSMAELFSKMRESLIEAGVIARRRMKWRDSFIDCKEIVLSLSSGDSNLFIGCYLELTRQDPRKSVPVKYDSHFAACQERLDFLRSVNN